jgi:hypothetical protein
MDNEKIINAIVIVLQNIYFDNVDIAERQLISARDLLESVMINLAKDKKCTHPKDVLKNLTSMGDTEKTEQCMVCGEIIKSEF